MIYYYYHYDYDERYIYIYWILVGEVYKPTWSTYNSEAPSGKTQRWATLLLRTCETGVGSFRELKARLHVRSPFLKTRGNDQSLVRVQERIVPRSAPPHVLSQLQPSGDRPPFEALPWEPASEVPIAWPKENTAAPSSARRRMGDNCLVLWSLSRGKNASSPAKPGSFSAQQKHTQQPCTEGLNIIKGSSPRFGKWYAPLRVSCLYSAVFLGGHPCA